MKPIRTDQRFEAELTGPDVERALRFSAERRRLLRLLTLGVSGIAAGCSTRAATPPVTGGPIVEPTLLQGPPAAVSAIPTDPSVEILRRPIQLKEGDLLADRRFLLAPDFAWDSTTAAIYGKGPGITIRNVEIVGATRWQRRWDTYNEPSGGPRGIPSGCVGIRLQEAPGVRISDVTVHGFPGAGITAYGIDDGVVERVRVSDCFHGVVTEWYKPNRRVRVEGVEARDLWGPPPNKWPSLGGPRSKRFSDGYVGGDGLALASLSDSTVRDCTVSGEQFCSLKLVNPRNVEVSGIKGVGMMIQGTSDLVWKIDRLPARDVRILDCTIDKSLGTGAIVEAGNALQVSWNVESILIRGCTLRAAGHDGHAIEFAKNVHGRVEGCTIEGFNGMRSIVPAHAINVMDHSTVNDDFETVNRFVDQKRRIIRFP